ncbi:hypothetical protein, partial [Actinomadura fibrosa]
MSVQEALAAVLTSEEEHALLRDDPARLQRRYGLSDAELAMLAGARPAGFRVTRTNVQGKLRRAVTAFLPLTVAELTERHAALWEEFVARTVRRPQSDGRAPGLWEAERLVAWLSERATPPLADHARYELARVTLSRDREAARAARDHVAPAPGDALAVSAAVRVVGFEHDVTAGSPIAELPSARTTVLLRRRWGSPPVQAYRIGDGTAALLALCDGTRTADEAASAVGGDREQASAVLAGLAEAGVL